MTEDIKSTIDLTSGGITIGAIFEAIPEITALVALAWWILRIYETDTVQNFLKKK